MGFEKINARRKKLKEEREARIKSKGWQAEKKKYIQYMYNKYPGSERFTEANKRIFAVSNNAIEDIKDYKQFATLMLLAKQTIGTQSYDEEYVTQLINVDVLVATLTNDRTGKYKKEIFKTLLELQEDGVIRTEPALTKDSKLYDVFRAYFDKYVSFTTFDAINFERILLSNESVSNKLKMMRVLASVCSYMFYQDPKGLADSEKHSNSVCYANIDELADLSGMNERATQAFLDKLVELEVLAKFRVFFRGKWKNYYSKREESYYLIKYIEEQLTSGAVKYVEDEARDSENLTQPKEDKQVAKDNKLKKFDKSKSTFIKEIQQTEQELLADDSLDDVDDFEEIFNEEALQYAASV